MAKIRGSQKGLTMIEVLVSLMIFLVVLLAIYQLFDTSHATYASGTRKQDVQQQARMAMDEIVKRVRMAGYFPENFAAVPAVPALANRIRVGAANGLAVYGDMDQTGASKIFLFCFDGSSIRANTGAFNNANSYTCNQGDVLADNVTALSFQYFTAATPTAAPINPPALLAPPLDGQGLGATPDMTTTTARDSVETVIITLTARETVIHQDPQTYTLTSTVRLRNAN
jgi:prepilin-type N-terminal cleavage/methylation domain-containing protein